MSSLDTGRCDPTDAPTCIAPPAEDPCGAQVVVAATCDATSGWSCPSSAHVYARADDQAGLCLPFSELPTSIGAVAPWGVGGSFARVATDDGRCLWIAAQVTTPSGASVSNVALEVDRDAPFGSCPTTGTVVGGTPSSIVEIEGGADPSISVQIASAFRVGGVTRVAYRLFRADPSAVYGTVDLGGGLGAWDQASQRVVVRGPQALTFPTTLDLGDAAVVSAGSAYVWGCPKPGGFLMSDCIVARFDATNAGQLFVGDAKWTPQLDATAAVTGLKSGPWISSVSPDALSGGLLHAFIGGFGSSIQTQVAPSPVGPWSAPAPLLDCQLASVDAESYCAGPVIHPELADPTRPGEIVVGYEVGSTATNQAALMSEDPRAYWPRLAWVTVP